ncbi:hypothetical protein ACQUKI_01870 [Ralstonia pseudosolanacearum]
MAKHKANRNLSVVRLDEDSSVTQRQRVENLGDAQRERLAYIDFRYPVDADRRAGLHATPRLERSAIIKMDYGMTDCSNYMLLWWGVDCSPNHRLKEEQYRLWLGDPLALYGVENAKLAPGCRPPSGCVKNSKLRIETGITL